MKKTYLKLLILPSILFSSCAILPTMTCRNFEPGSKFEYPFYDEGSGLKYYVANDDSSIFISLNSTDQSTMQVLRREGITIYFDTLGKKKKEVYLKYPAGRGGMPGPPPQGMMQDQQQGQAMQTPPQGSQSQGNFQGNPPQQGQFPGMNMEQMPVATDASFVKDGQSHEFNIETENNDIKISVKQSTLGGITYNFTIPYFLLSDLGAEGLKKLSVGIVGTQPENNMGPGAGGPPMGSQGGGMGPGGGGGGMPPDGGGMGGPGGGQGGGPGGPGGGGPGGQQFQSTSKIDIWFKVNLNN